MPLNKETNRPDDQIVYKKREPAEYWTFATGGLLNENERKPKKREISRLCLMTKPKAMQHKGDDDTSCNKCARNNPQVFGKRDSKTWK